MIIPSKEQLKRLLSEIDRSFLLKIVLVFAAFIVPLIILYVIDSGSFDYLWKGRAPYFLFLWLFGLETALGWKNLKGEHTPFWTKKTVLAAVILLLPTVYAAGLNFGLHSGIVELGRAVGVPIINGDTWYLTHSWPFSFEYVLFAVFFVASIWLLYGVRGLKAFSVSAFFVGGVGIFYMIDTFYPNGTFTVLQSLVPITTSGVTAILNLLGYTTETWPAGQEGLYLEVSMGGGEPYTAIIAWSCAGSHSLFLYSFMIMLFLRGTSISRMRKIIYVAVGAAGTFFVNLLRIVTIYVIGINSGGSPAKLFHEFYGEFFFIAWMFIYLTIVFLFETRFISKFSGAQKRDQPPLDKAQTEPPQRLERDKKSM
jgi:thaumarchaeosortase